MEKLPDELLDIIADCLPPEALAPYATLSSRWQSTIERRTFYRLQISSADEDMDCFTLSITPSRIRYLKQLYLTILVPFHETRIISAEGQEARFSAAFTDALRKLFQALAGTESSIQNASTSQGIESWIHFFISEVKSPVDIWDELNGYLTRRIQLVEYESLPFVQCVSRLGIYDPQRKFALRTAIELSTRLPNLCGMELEKTIQDKMFIFASNFRLLWDSRKDLAEAFAKADNLSGSHLRHFTVLTDELEPRDGLFKPVSDFRNYYAITLEPSYDPLGVAIRTLSQNLTYLNLSGTFDVSLFWPTQAEIDGTITRTSSISLQWPCLKHMIIKLGLCTPNGEWYFKAKPRVGHRRSTRLRPMNVPVDDELQHVFASWSKALSHMPVLRSATIWFHLEMTPQKPSEERYFDKWVVGFHAPGEIPDPTIFTSHNAKVTMEELYNSRLVFERTDGWRPTTNTMERLQKMAKDRFAQTNLVEIDVNILGNVTRK
ncbi:hypothetical protein PFICI_03216 [Pestalotiopsis fici W106-1]|uniref:F-box domain-containing protein n=1 Tax=Pestalotiopsis fici (strain W106-1 / CGMCC3.15140) TaxID=1229662 RepID=W3XIZ4_PESFW|nr:uncharacterized protein PFICI_03216 [Pestalotiopsis fici W106-1]ETS85191.1 hypothetical protein PFICI_03216 [Pestalotiopsis fici W106-1]